jgi:hypothetical protein
MTKQLLTLLLLALCLQVNAQELFRPSGMTASSAAHKKFMLSKKTEATKRATTWKVPVFMVQLIASVQSGAGTESGFNYGQVLPHPGLTKYSKFSAVGNDGLLTCIKKSRGVEAIALALNAIKSNNKNTLKTSRDYMEIIFGAGGDLESMAKEAEKAYTVYTKKTIKLYVEKPAEVVTAPKPEPTVSISETKLEMGKTETAVSTSGNLVLTEADTKITKVEEKEVVITPEVRTEAEQAAALKAAQLKASMAAEQELVAAQKTAGKKRMNSEMGMRDGNADAKEKGRLEADKRESEIEHAARILEKEKIARAEKNKLKKKPKKVVISEKTFDELSGDFFTDSEDLEPSKKKKRRVGFGFKAGLNASKLLVKNDDSETSEDDSFKFGAMGGVAVDLPLTNSLSIETGAQFSMKGSKYKGSKNELDPSFTRTLNYIQIPAHFKIIPNNGNSSFFFQGGPYLGIAINGSSESTLNGNKETNDINIGSSDTDFIKLVDFGIGAGFGVQFGAIQIGLTYDFGLANLTNLTDNGGMMKNRVAGLFVGYRL